MIGQPIADLEKVTEVPSGSAYIANMGDGSGTKTVPQEILTKEVGRALKVGDLSELQTENKNNLVAAINEAAQSGGGGSAVDILDTKEEIEANTEPGKAAGAQAVKEMFGALNDNLKGFTPVLDQLISESLSASSVARRLLYSYVNNTGKPVKAVFGGVKALTNCSGNDAYLSICLDDVEQNRVPLKTGLYTIVPLELIVPTGSTLLIYTNWGGSSHSEVVWSLSGILNVYRC